MTVILTSSNGPSSITNDKNYLLPYSHKVNLLKIQLITRNLATLKNEFKRWFVLTDAC